MLLGTSIIVEEGVSVQNLEKGVSTLQLGLDTPDILYYMASNDLNAAGTIVVKDISEATFIDVESESRFNFNPTIIIKGVPTYYLEMENASRDNANILSQSKQDSR